VPQPEGGDTVVIEQSEDAQGAEAVATLPAGSGSLAETGIASSVLPSDGFAAAVSPLDQFNATGPTPESASSAPVVTTGFGPALVPAVDRLLATARPRDELSGLGFRGRIVFPNTNMQDRSATLPGPLEQPFGIFLTSGVSADDDQPTSEEALAASRNVAVADAAEVEAEGDAVDPEATEV
jgi:hypothetical protein